MRDRMVGGGLAALALVAVIGCSSTTGGSPAASAAGASTAPSEAASSQAAPSEAAPSEAAPSQAAPSQAAPSEAAIPSYAFPSEDKELEALLPDKICGETALKLSMSGDTFASGADESFIAALAEMGKTTDDVSMAVAGGQTSECSAAIFRVKGADPNKFKQVMLAAAAKEGSNYTEKQIGGKTVLVDPTSSAFQYGYFKGDGLIFVNAKNDADAASIIADLP